MKNYALRIKSDKLNVSFNEINILNISVVKKQNLTNP